MVNLFSLLCTFFLNWHNVGITEQESRTSFTAHKNIIQIMVELFLETLQAPLKMRKVGAKLYVLFEEKF